jgi:hypothetical protein
MKDTLDAPMDRKMNRLAGKTVKTGGALPPTPYKKTVKTGGALRPAVRPPVKTGGNLPPKVKTFNTGGILRPRVRTK